MRAAFFFLALAGPWLQEPQIQPPLPAPGPADLLAEIGLEFSSAALADLLAASPRPPLPPSPGNPWADDLGAARLGQRLFFDPGLSWGGATHCASCHPPNRLFTNGVMDLRGPEALRRQSPTLVDAAYLPWFGWTGSSDSLWAQALGPLEDVTEHDGNRVAFVHHLAEAPELAASYAALFGPLPSAEERARWPREAKPIPARPSHRLAQAWQAMAPAQQEAASRVLVNIGKAIEAYERRLLSGPAPFDAFVDGLRRGDRGALEAYGPAAARGALVFFERARCQRCHSGPNFSDGGFHDNRAPVLEPEREDPGRALGLAKLAASPFNAWGPFGDPRLPPPALPDAESQRGLWRTAPLRNLSRPGGYTHEGQLHSLSAVIEHYSSLAGARPAEHGRPAEVEPLNLSVDERADLESFLRSLQGPPPPETWRQRPRAEPAGG